MAYTWSKDLTTASGDTNFVRIDQYTRLANYGPSSNDRRHNFALNYVYDLPDSRNSRTPCTRAFSAAGRSRASRAS